MQQLISITQNTVNDASIQTVNARELHAFLESGIRFNDWIRKRIQDYGFAEGVDYVRIELAPDMKMSDLGGDIGGITNTQKNVALESTGYGNFGQQGRIEYAISLDMGKELAMVERNEKGKQARQYFIECERLAKRDPVELLNDPSAMRGLLLSYSEKVITLEKTVLEQAPKVAALDRIATSDGSLCIMDAAKTLQLRPKDVFQWMQTHDWIYKRTGASSYTAYQERIKQGVLEHKTALQTLPDGTEKTRTQVRVTSKGLAKLAEIFNVRMAA